MDRADCANCTAEVGYRGAVFVAVIAVGGTGCIGAYLTVPSCRLYGTVNWPGVAGVAPPGAGAATGAVASLLMAAGGAGPVTANAAAETAAGNTPVIPVRVKWLE
jgi:hypothetical protein